MALILLIGGSILQNCPRLWNINRKYHIFINLHLINKGWILFVMFCRLMQWITVSIKENYFWQQRALDRTHDYKNLPRKLGANCSYAQIYTIIFCTTHTTTKTARTQYVKSVGVLATGTIYIPYEHINTSYDQNQTRYTNMVWINSNFIHAKHEKLDLSIATGYGTTFIDQNMFLTNTWSVH